MERPGELNDGNGRNNANAIALVYVLEPLWHARRLIAAGTTAAILLGVSGTLYLPTYMSEGFLQFGGAIPLPNEKTGKDRDNDKEPSGIMLADFKRYMTVFNTSSRFDAFVKQGKLEGEVEVGNLRRLLASRDGISKMVVPVYTFTKLDAKELMAQPKDGSNNVIGLRINYQTNIPENAQRMVGLLGQYSMDTIVYMIYSDALRFKHSEMTSKITWLDNDIIASKAKLAECRRRGDALKVIVARYPASANHAAGMMVVTDENSHYLSPVTHLMSTEVEAANANEDIAKAGRAKQQSLLLLEYYDHAKSLLDTNKSGEAILRGLEPVKESVFKGKDLNDELIREVYNAITIENQKAMSLYLEKSHFIAGPNLPENRTTRLSSTLLLSTLVGLLASSLFVLGRNWWRANRLKMGA